MIKTNHDKDDNNDGMGWVVCGGVGGVVRYSFWWAGGGGGRGVEEWKGGGVEGRAMGVDGGG